jgi:hypothetical protein
MKNPKLSSFNTFVIGMLYGIPKNQRTPSEQRLLDQAYNSMTNAQTLAQFVISELDTKESLSLGESAVLNHAKYPHLRSTRSGRA